MAQSNPQKLGVHGEAPVSILGLDVAEASRVLGLPAATLVADSRGTTVTVLFADDVAAVTAHTVRAVASRRAGGRTWVAYRKGASRRSAGDEVPLHRDTLQSALAALGLDGVTLISLDDEWSAMRVTTA